MIKKINKQAFVIWSGFYILAILAFHEFFNLNILTYIDIQNIWGAKRFLVFLIISVLFFLFALYSLFLILQKRLIASGKLLNKSPYWFESIITFILILTPGLVKWILPLPENFTIGFWMESFIIFSFALFIQLLFHNDEPPWKAYLRIGCFILFAGTGYAILYKFSQVTGYPFPLYWSEGNRFFDYSALFGSYRYLLPEGEKIKAFTTWGMQLPWAIPFIFPGLTIGFFRLWYQLMWILPTFILGITAAWRVNTGRSSLFLTLIFACWTFLFLDQGPIYAPLVIGAIMTLIAVRAKLFPGVLIIFAASYYTRNSRWTWLYAPGLWAGLLALLAIDSPSFSKQGLKELIKPVTLGFAGYLGGYLIPSAIKSFNSSSGLALLPKSEVAISITRQPLLWARLFPNPTFPPGILWGLVWAALPVILLLGILILQNKWRTNWLHNLILVIVSGGFLVVGIIASVKIGGGSNLHNLDMFLMTLVLIASSAFNFLINKNKNVRNLSPITSVILFIALISPASFTFMGGERLSLPTNKKISETLTAVQNIIEQYNQQGEILFIDHRQLLTFKFIDKVPLVDEYEKKYLMDKAMANNENYFSSFHEDLAERRFALIVNEPLEMVLLGSEYSFGEENNAYVKWVTIPLICSYEPLYSSPETSVELLIPRKTPPPANLNCGTFFSAEK